MKENNNKELAKIRKFLCEHYDKKCYTNKCPMRKYFCFDFPSIESIFRQTGLSKRNEIIELMYKSATELGYKPE